MVEAMTAFGITQEEIAACIGENGISVTTLSKYFSKEIRTGTAKLVTSVAIPLVTAAKKVERDPRYQASAIFLLKTRGKWSAPDRRIKVEPVDQGGGKSSGSQSINIILEKDDLDV